MKETMTFLYLPSRNKIESAIPLTQVLRINYSHDKNPAKADYNVQLVGGSRIELGPHAPYTKVVIEPVGWERWTLETVVDLDVDPTGATRLPHWVASPVMSLVRCADEPTGDVWFQEPDSHGFIDTPAAVLYVDIHRQACRFKLDDEWSSDLVGACQLMLKDLKAKSPTLRELTLPPWLTPAETPAKPLRKGKAA